MYTTLFFVIVTFLFPLLCFLPIKAYVIEEKRRSSFFLTHCLSSDIKHLTVITANTMCSSTFMCGHRGNKKTTLYDSCSTRFFSSLLLRKKKCSAFSVKCCCPTTMSRQLYKMWMSRKRCVFAAALRTNALQCCTKRSSFLHHQHTASFFLIIAVFLLLPSDIWHHGKRDEEALPLFLFFPTISQVTFQLTLTQRGFLKRETGFKEQASYLFFLLKALTWMDVSHGLILFTVFLQTTVHRCSTHELTLKTSFCVQNKMNEMKEANQEKDALFILPFFPYSFLLTLAVGLLQEENGLILFRACEQYYTTQPNFYLPYCFPVWAYIVILLVLLLSSEKVTVCGCRHSAKNMKER